MSYIPRPRIWFSLLAALCALLLAYALYVQHVEFLDPCPLCILQRVAYAWIGVVALLAAAHDPGAAGRWVYGLLVVAGSVLGLVIAGRHVWLQSLPADQVPDCGMGLTYMLQTLPLGDALQQVFRGSGECAAVDWTLLGMSMPAWNLVAYAGITVLTLIVLSRQQGSCGRRGK